METAAEQQATLTVTAKGQVTLRKDVLRHLGVQPGEKIVVDKLPNGQLKIRAARQIGHISKFFGSLQKNDGIHLTIEEINEVAAKGWAGEL
jgi:bifunctional DNA-binding transcriptional regulator/antitoxin component of YhaV-PrlF toxin-antitoxin module